MMRMMHGVLVVASVAAALTGGGAPIAQADHVGCIIHAVGPSKEVGPSNAPIQFGWKVWCNGQVDARKITTSLYRVDYDQGGKTYLQNRAVNESTDVETEELYLSECAIDGRTYGFYTLAEMWAYHGKDDDSSNKSDEVLLQC